jgi:hypothetical protein
MSDIRKQRLDQIAAGEAPSELVAAQLAEIRAYLDENRPPAVATKAEVFALRTLLAVFLGHFAQIVGKPELAAALNEQLHEKTVRTIENGVVSGDQVAGDEFKKAAIAEVGAFFGLIEECGETIAAMAESEGKTKS